MLVMELGDQDSNIRILTPKVGAHLGVWRFIPSRSPTFSKAWNVTPELHSLMCNFTNPCLGCEPKVRVATMHNLQIAFVNYKKKWKTLPINEWQQEHQTKFKAKSFFHYFMQLVYFWKLLVGWCVPKLLAKLKDESKVENSGKVRSSRHVP